MTGSISVAELQTRIKERGAAVLVPVFEEAMTLTEQWLQVLSDKQRGAGETDNASKQRDALIKCRLPGRLALQEELTATASRMMLYRGMDAGLSGLSLLDDESLDLQLAHERLADTLKRRHRAGIAALDQRVSVVLGAEALGPRLPLSAIAIADAARAGAKALDVDATVRAVALRRFEDLVSAPLFDLHRELNEMLAKGGVLPDLVVADEEERRRAQTRSAQARAQLETSDDEDAPAAGGAGGSGGSAPDRALLSTLVSLLQGMRPAPVHAGPRRELSSNETVSLLSTMQRAPPEGLAEVLAKGDGSLADILKREMLGRAQAAQPQGPAPALSSPEEVAVELVGNLFDVMMQDRGYADAVAPLIARMVTPYVKASVIEPTLFETPAHPARKLLNTVSEVVEDNEGGSDQELELLRHVGAAIDRLNDEFDMDLDTFEQIEKELSSKLEMHRRRFALAEKRASEAQQGQERLERARQTSGEAVRALAQDREVPRPLGDFLTGPWQHHLTMLALRQGQQSEPYQQALAVGRRWVDLADMASLGEPPSPQALASLQADTEKVLASSGMQGEQAHHTVQGLAGSLKSWADGDADVAMAAPVLLPEALPTPVPGQAVSIPETAAPPAAAMPSRVIAEGARPKHDTLAEFAKAGEGPPTPEEIAEIRALPLNGWLQLPKASGELQVVKLSWVSGISGLMMFVNRRGARALAATPEELVLFKRRGQLLAFEREAPVDQALHQMADRLKKRASDHNSSSVGQ
jgi:hypothetical protein